MTHRKVSPTASCLSTSKNRNRLPARLALTQPSTKPSMAATTTGKPTPTPKCLPMPCAHAEQRPTAFDISKESPAIRREYGPSPFGQGCLLARRLVEYGLRFVEVGLGGWDTHFDNFGGVQTNAAMLDQALSALLIDLAQRGMLDRTLVVVATEFGRTPTIIEAHKNGRDHHPTAFSCVVAGGGVKAVRPTARPTSKAPQSPTARSHSRSERHDRLGPWPADDRELPRRSGQQFQIAADGEPVTDLFA